MIGNYKTYSHQIECKDPDCGEITVLKVTKTKDREMMERHEIACRSCGSLSAEYEVKLRKVEGETVCLDCKGVGKKRYENFGIVPCEVCGGKGKIKAEHLRKNQKNSGLYDFLNNL